MTQKGVLGVKGARLCGAYVTSERGGTGEGGMPDLLSPEGHTGHMADLGAGL